MIEINNMTKLALASKCACNVCTTLRKNLLEDLEIQKEIRDIKKSQSLDYVDKI